MWRVRECKACVRESACVSLRVVSLQLNEGPQPSGTAKKNRRDATTRSGRRSHHKSSEALGILIKNVFRMQIEDGCVKKKHTKTGALYCGIADA